ncbi:MAG: molybdopterin-guanine dinucleotide biosynthesis protein B [Proteobacteria bacterium]|nr:molybdopterin-guanine dinucleotide biosynthesis protein B [Pseudomonadota bacterium]
MPVVAFVSRKSGTGKTTLLTGVLKCLKERGYRIGTVKHSFHPIQVDHEGKDSFRHFQAGAGVTVVSSPGILVTIRKVGVPSMDEICGEASKDVDIVLVEGFKDLPHPKIEVFRSGFSEHPLAQEDGDRAIGVAAVASDVPLNIDVPVLPLNNPEAVCDFIETRFLKRERRKKGERKPGPTSNVQRPTS